MDALERTEADCDLPGAGPEAVPETTLIMTRTFKAPPALLFRVWTQPEHIARWWGCGEALYGTRFKNDLRVGGGFSAEMNLDDGGTHFIRGVYKEIEEPTHLVFTWAWENTQGFKGDGTLVTLSFREMGMKTEMMLRHERFAGEPDRTSHGEGWGYAFDRLAGYLPTIAEA